jgi:hypothetical protein
MHSHVAPAGRTFARAVALVSLTLAVVPALARAQDAALPPARDLIAKYAAAIGGDAWKTHKSARMKATLEIPSAGLSAQLEVLHKYPNIVFTKVEVPGLGQMREGFDGTNGWQVNPMVGARLLTGPEGEQAKDNADPANYTRQTPNIVSSETVERAEYDGKACYRVKHTWKSGRVTFDCFSVDDGLIVASQSKQTGPMGEMETTVRLGAYKDFAGVKRPTTVTQEAMGQMQVITVTAWEWDNVDDKELELPAEIKALVEKKP